MVLARASAAAATYAWGEARWPADDQIALSRYSHEHPAAGAVDTQRELSRNVGIGRPRATEADLKGSGAFFIHFPYQVHENGINAVLLNTVARVVALAPSERARAAADVVHAWEPWVDAALARHARLDDARCVCKWVAIVAAVAAGALACAALHSIGDGCRVCALCRRCAARERRNAGP
jgi:hypothetical protein